MELCVKWRLTAATAYRILRPPAALAFSLWLALQAQGAHAADCTAASDGASLATAIGEVNAGSCDTINITSYIALASQNLPVIDRNGATITIQGSGGPQIVDGTGTSRLFAVITGDVTISDINIENGVAKGGEGGSDNGGGGGAGGALGAGGGLFVGAGATVTLRNVDLGGNTAQGGDGGNATDTSLFGGGGGGGGLNGGDGGSDSTSNKTGGKGGGGGFGADGAGLPATNTQAGGGGGGGGNGATPGSAGGAGNIGGAGGTGDGGSGGAGSNGNSGNDGTAGNGLGGGGGSGMSNNPNTAPGAGGDGGALGGGGGGGGASGLAPNTGSGGDGGNGGFGGGGGGGGSILENDAGTWSGGAGGMGGFGAGGGGGGSAYSFGAATPAGGTGGAAGFLGGTGGDGGAAGSQNTGGGGGGGAGLGGAIFVQNGGTLNIGQNVYFGGAGANAVAGGGGGSSGPDTVDGADGGAGSAAGANIYAIDGAAGLGSNATVGFDLDSGQIAVLGDADLGLLQAGYSGQLRKSGAGELVLQSTSGFTTGGWSVVAGILRGTTDNLIGAIANDGLLILDQGFDGTLAGDLTGSGSLVKAQAGNVTLSGDNDAYTGDVVIQAGTLTVNGSGIGDGSSVTVALGGSLTVGAAGETVGSLAGAGDVTLNGALDAGGNNTSTVFSGDISGSGSLTKSGSGTLTLTGTNSYSGGTTIDAGTLIGTTSSLIGAIVNNSALAFAQTFDGTYAGAISDSGSLTKSGSGSVTLSGNNSYSGGTTIDAGTLVGTTSSLIGAIVNNSALAFAQTFDGTYAGDISGSGSLTKSGTGTLTLSGTNSYAGGTTIAAGTLVGTTSSLTGDILNNGALEFDQATNGTHAGDISGSGSLTKSGSGSVTLSGTNSYSGGTTIDAGTLIGTTSSLIGAIANNGALAFAQTFDGTYAGDISGSGGLTKSGSGTVILTGNNSYSGGTTINAGRLVGTTSSVTGDIVNNGALEFEQAANGTYTGQISGSGSLTKSGTGTLTLTGTNSHTGGTTIDAGTLRGTALTLAGDILNNATIEFAQSVDDTYAGDISGTGSLVKTGAGTLYLTGMNSYTGPTTVTAGTLSVNGAVLSSVNVSSGATLKGSGGVGQIVAQGIVAPGNSIGTMTVTGDLVLAPGSVLEIEFDDAGNADRIVVSGTVTLDGTLRLLPEAGGYVTNTQYLIIDAGAVAGTFADSETVDETRLGGLQATVTITADQVLLELASASFGGGAGAGGGPVADYIDELRPSASGDLADVISELEVLPLETIDEALQSLSPQTVDVIPTVQAAYGRLLTDVMERRLQRLRTEGIGGALPSGLAFTPQAPIADNYSTGSLATQASPSWEEGLLGLSRMAEQSGSILEAGDTEETLWVQLIGEYGRRKDQEAFLGYDYQLFGAISGYEHRLSPEWQVGANVAIGRSEVDFDRDRGSNDGMSYAGGVYLGWTPQSGVAIDLLGWGGLTNVQSRRNIVFGGIDRQADGETDVTSLGVELRGELSKDWDALHVGGFAGVRYTNNWQDDYCETGAGSVNLCVEAMRTSEVAGEVGAAVAYEVDVGSGALTLDVQGAVTATQPLDDRAIRSSFAGEPGGFVIPGDDDGELGLSPRIGLSYRRNDQLSFSLNYSAHLGQDTVAHGIHAGVAFRF